MADSVIKNAWERNSTTIATGLGEDIDLHLKKSGKVVMMLFNDGTFTNYAINKTIFTIPEGYRPIDVVDFVDTYSGKRLLILQDGRVEPKDILTAVILRGTITYLTN